MQIIEVYLVPGEGGRAVELLKRLEVEDINFIKSETGDLLVIKHPLDKTNRILDVLQQEFDFKADSRRSIIMLSPSAVLPREAEKEKKLYEESSKECIVEYAEQNAYLNSKYLALFFFSAVVATLGMITNNVAVVVGAMIIAPAFGPISSVAVGAVTNRMDLFKQGIKTEMVGVCVAVGTAAVMGFIIPGIEVTGILQQKMFPGIFDLFIGLAAGAAGGYVLVSGRGAGIVGVMVAAALLPVMTAIGLSFVFLNPFFVLGGFLLLLITVLSIILSMVVVFWFVGPQRDHIHLARDYHITQAAVKRIVRYSVVLIVILAIPLVWMTYEDLVTRAPEKEINKVFEETPHDVDLGGFTIRENAIRVTVYNLGASGSELEELYSEIKGRIDARYDLEFNVVETNRMAG